MRLAAALCLILSLLPAAGRAAPADCPPAGRLPDYLAAEAPKLRSYDAFEFTTFQDGTETPTMVAGQLCQQSYGIKEGAEILSDAEIQANYRDQLARSGGEILYKGPRYTTARIAAAGQETWVQVYSGETAVDVTVLRKQPHRQVLTKPSGNDHRLLGHMPDFIAAAPLKRNFDQVNFTVHDEDGDRDIQLQGAKFVLGYAIKDGVNPPSDLDIQQNYRTALTALGAQIVFVGGHYTTAHLETGGASLWFSVYSSESGVELVVLEEKALTLSIVPPAEDALKKTLDTDGHVALYVPFDFDRATLKPEAAPVIALMVKLLKDNPAIKVTIEGHTDNIGGQDYNLKLSDARAKAVVEAVVAGGVARERAAASGIGAARPIADNATAEGRAKNRRVELVKS